MAAIHAVDLDAVGLTDLGRHEGYIARQLKRWYGQWNDQKTRDARRGRPRSTTRSSQRIPEQGPATIVHGDYRLDNCMVGDDGTIARRARLGDLHARRSARRRRPAAGVLDRSRRRAVGVGRLGHHRRRLPRPRRPRRPVRDGQRARPLAARRSTSRSPTGSWRASCEGVYSRYLGGALGSRDPAELEPFIAQIDGAAARAAECLEALP